MNTDSILLDHGSGGLASQELIRQLFLAHLDHPALAALEDSAVLDNDGGRLAFTTDSYVVDPIFFPGGDIGMLAVNGTINDLAMRGARPRYLSLGLILEEGFALSDLERIISSIARSSRGAAVPVVTGDTKVVPRGKGDKIYINTSGIGTLADGINISCEGAKTGDLVILSGTMGDHGITVLVNRSAISLESHLTSDTMPLHRLVEKLVTELPDVVHSLRDPTRGGVATAVSEIAQASEVGIILEETAIPVRPEVRAACEMLGIDPLYLANEGKCLALVDPRYGKEVLAMMRSRPEGSDSAVIGQVTEGPAGRVELKTTVGGSRLVTPLTGEPLPRIC